ncbi:MAG: hypothetical protein OHK0031_06530 [Anaerolineales bacterium]
MSSSRWIFLTFCLAVLLNGAAAFWLIPPPVLTRETGVSGWEARLEPLKRALPAELRVVGYVSDLDLLQNPSQEEIFKEIDELPLTQYSLAPILVRPGLNEEWLIGNFTRPGMKAYLDAQLPAGYEIQSFGFGIYLIHRP